MYPGTKNIKMENHMLKIVHVIIFMTIKYEDFH